MDISMIDIYTPQTMGAMVSQMLPTRTFLKDTFFPSVQTFDTETIMVDYSKEKRYMAPFVNDRLGGSNVTMEGYETKSFEPALIAPQTTTNIDMLTRRSFGEPVFGGMSPAQRAAKKMGEDLRALENMIIRREEWMCAQVLFNGKIPLKGRGINREFDFGFTNKTALTGSALWSNPDSDIFGFLQDCEESVHKSTGLNIDMLLMSRDSAKAFMNNKAIKEIFHKLNIMPGQLSPKDLPNGVKYLGYLTNPAVDLYIYDEWYFDNFTDPENPVTKPMVPEKTILIGTKSSLGSVLYGAVTLIDAKTETFTTYEGTRVADSWITKNPDQRFIRISARPLPVPKYFDGWCVAQVLA